MTVCKVTPQKVSYFIKPALLFGNKMQLCDHINTYSFIEGNYEFIVVAANASLPRKSRGQLRLYLNKLKVMILIWVQFQT